MYICSKCGMKLSKPEKKARGFAGLILMLILFVVFLFILPIISIIIVILDYMWYHGSIKKMCCPHCGGTECVIPINSPMGKKIAQDLSAKASSVDVEKVSGLNRVEIVYDPKMQQYVKVRK